MRRNYGALRSHECELISKASHDSVVHELRNGGSVSIFVRRNYGASRNHECELFSKASLGFVVHEL